MLSPNNFVFPEETNQEQVVNEGQIGESSAIPSGGENEEQIQESNEETVHSSNEEPTQATHEGIALRRSPRQTQLPIKFKDYVSHQVMYPIKDFISYKKVSPEYRAYLGKITNQTEPTSFEEADLDPIW